MVAAFSHQTVRLAPGSHRGPEDGACVLELASMLGQEPFSDHPNSVCPALREFLQGYNDGVPDELRHALLPLASEIVGSRSPAQVTAWRARLSVDWGRSAARLVGIRTRFGTFTLENCAHAGRYAALAAGQDIRLHERTVMFFQWLAQARSPRGGSPSLPTALLPPAKPQVRSRAADRAALPALV
jgi:hypothetical protein